jgi:trehalose 6-phosphate phosphatase
MTGAGGERPQRSIRDLPDALEAFTSFLRQLGGATPAVFLDYDGTLTPIVADPSAATLPALTRRAVERLLEACPVAVVSGRDLDDVRELVQIDRLPYAGSHGFDIRHADGRREQRGTEFLPALDQAEARLSAALAPIPGAWLERKRFAVTAHFRQAPPERTPEVEAVVDEAAAAEPALRKTGGKKVFELRPAVDWNKGRALLWLLDVLGLDRDRVRPVYIGDDVTDEDAFRAIAGWGIGVVVRGEDDARPTAADYALADTGAVTAFLNRLADHCAKALHREGQHEP